MPRRKTQMADIGTRKSQHLDIVLGGNVAARDKLTGFDAIQFEHAAAPEIDLEAIDLSTSFLGRKLSAPFLISSMTGGPQRAAAINFALAQAAQALGIAFAVGSQRIAVEGGEHAGFTRHLRTLAPTIPILANLGAAQIRSPAGLDHARRAVAMIEADALIIHLNPLQEAVQSGGDRNWTGVLSAIEQAVIALPVPVVIKEVGCGLSATLAKRLTEIGVTTLDVAGAGGTSWAAVEAERADSPRDKAIAAAFRDWGIPTATAIAQVRAACPHATVIASGGLKTGIDAAKSIRLGADLCGFAASILAAALDSPRAVVDQFDIAIQQLRISCFCTGSADLAALRHARLIGDITKANTCP
ncbi:MAG: type 2 isopentenyl-diphosphate Delta-isomerase [Hyphomicrobiaceae bacterium]